MNSDLEFLIDFFAQQGRGEPWRKRVLTRYCTAPTLADWRFLAGMKLDGPNGKSAVLRIAVNEVTGKSLPEAPDCYTELPKPEEIAAALTWMFMGG